MTSNKHIDLKRPIVVLVPDPNGGGAINCVDAADQCERNRDLCFQRALQSSMAQLCARTCGQCASPNSQGRPRPNPRPGRGQQNGPNTRDPSIRQGQNGVGGTGGGSINQPDLIDPYRPDRNDAGNDNMSSTMAPEPCPNDER